MKCSLLFALALRAQCGNAFVGPTGGLALSNCVSAAAAAHNGIVRRGVASTPQARAAAASDADSDVSADAMGAQQIFVRRWLLAIAVVCLVLLMVRDVCGGTLCN